MTTRMRWSARRRLGLGLLVVLTVGLAALVFRRRDVS